MLNDFHGGAYGGHLFGIFTTQKLLRAGYYWSSIFKDCLNAVKRCHPYRVFAQNMRSHLALLHPIITINPFNKWGVEFMDCNPTLAGGIITLQGSQNTSRNEKRLCLRLNMMVIFLLTLYSFRLSHGLESRRILTLTMEDTFKTI